MTVSAVFSLGLRRAVRGLGVLAALAALGFATAAALMYFWVLPNIADHRDTVANVMSRALGQRVTLEAVSGVWQQARPEFRLQGVRLYDQQDRSALYLPELKATFSWRSLLFLEPRFSHIELQGLTLGVRRAQDGHFYVGGIPVNPAASDSGFINWLLRQGRVHVSKATLTWLDEVRHAPPVTLNVADFSLTNALRSHRLHLSATPPASLARPLVVDAQWTARKPDDVKTWSGRIETRVAVVSFLNLAPWLELPYQPQQGAGALHVTFDFERGTLTQVDAGFNLRAVETVLGENLPALRLAQLLGQVTWKQDADGRRVTFEDLRIARPGSALSAPFSVGVAWNARSHEITAKAFGLSGWESVLPSLPLDAALRTRLQALQARGRFDTLRFRWNGAEPGLDNFSIAARFTGLGVAASGNQPGIENLSGHIEGDARAGVFTLDSRKLAIHFPTLFRDPVLGFDEIRAQGHWKKTARGRMLTLDEAAFANPDAAGTAKGRYELLAGQPGIVDLGVHLTRVDGTAVYRYLPNKIGDDTVNWLKTGFKAGHSDDVRLTLQGDVTQFPFEQGKGKFRLEAQVKDAVLDYAQGWPRIDGIHARVLFQGKAMEITSSQARIYGVALSPVKAVIPDLIHHEEQLHIEGEANGPLQDFIRFANFSPVGGILRGFTDTLSGSGPTRLALKLHVPLRHSRDTTLAGRLSLLNGTLFPSGLPRVDQVRGDIDFTGNSLTAKNMTAQFLGGPLSIDTLTRNGQVQILARGRATAAGLAPWLGAPWDKRLSGQAAWRGQVDLELGGERVRIESDLKGLASSLPAPLAKPAEQPLSLLVTSQPQADGQQQEIQFGSTVGAVWRNTREGRFARGEVRFGGAAVIPNEPGLRLAGVGRGLDFSGWLALLPGGNDDDPLSLTSMDLSFDVFDLMGRRYQDVRLQGRTRNGLFRTQVSGHELNGVLTYRPASVYDSTGASARSGSEYPQGASRSLREQPARVSAQFKQLTIPDASPATGVATAINLKGAEFPILDLSVEDFRLQSRTMGRLEAVARGAPQGLVIENLRLTHPDSVLQMSGLWRDSGTSETRADMSLNVLDAGKFLARFGYPGTLKRGSVDIQGNATWTGSPADFSFATLAGQLDFKARDGQFLKLEPGVGKLLGVLSLQSLPRRLNFDFRDIFNEGYAFDEIGATLRIARGVVYSDDFKMRGPSAKVNMSGLADINQESVQLRMKVIPKLSEGIAVAGALIGGPLAGVGALAAQKLLRDPFEEAISQEYMVTGPWLTPDVKRLPKTKGNTESQVTEP
ncbi:MAG: TIGR02099 family protein [Thiobacillus sp.]|nr:TIGR02099 family protein [Thiobacillus sp.]